MFPSENLPPRGPASAGDEASLGVPSRDGLVSLSQAAEVLGYRGQELWNMLRGAGITIHRVDWDDCRGSAITLRDLFRLRQAQMPRQPGASGRARPAMPAAAPPPPPPPAPDPEPPSAPAPAPSWVAGSGPGTALPGGPDGGEFDPSGFGADMDRLRDLVRDAQLRNEYLSVELQQLRQQMATRAHDETRATDAALHHVRAQTSATIADLRNQVQASSEALEEAAEALESERLLNRELEKQVRELRSDLRELSKAGELEDLRETLDEERQRAASVQHDLERSLSLQRRTIARLEREKQALAERLGVRDEVERNNQRYIDKLERRIEELRRERGRD